MLLELHMIASGESTFTRRSNPSFQALPVDGVVFAVAGAFSAASVMILIRRIGLGEVDWRVTLLYQVKQSCTLLCVKIVFEPDLHKARTLMTLCNEKISNLELWFYYDRQWLCLFL